MPAAPPVPEGGAAGGRCRVRIVDSREGMVGSLEGPGHYDTTVRPDAPACPGPGAAGTSGGGSPAHDRAGPACHLSNGRGMPLAWAVGLRLRPFSTVAPVWERTPDARCAQLDLRRAAAGVRAGAGLPDGPVGQVPRGVVREAAGPGTAADRRPSLPLVPRGERGRGLAAPADGARAGAAAAGVAGRHLDDDPGWPGGGAADVPRPGDVLRAARL